MDMRKKKAAEKKPKNKFVKFLKTFVLSCIVCTVCVIIFMSFYILGIKEWQTFDPSVVEDMQTSLKLYDVKGEEYLTLYNTENRVYVGIEQIPEHVKNAFLAIEDVRFYSHGGIDLVRIMGALWEDIKSGSMAQGASTISQQVVKYSVLKNEKTIARKLSEILMTVKLESAYSKDEILELYLNRVYFGEGAYGVEKAAEEYLGKNVEDLSIAEGALLAAILKSPTHYNPRTNEKKSMTRKNLVLYTMWENGFLSEQEYADALAEQITILPNQESTYLYGYYTDMVLSEAVKKLTVTYAELLGGGYKIYTYLDTEMQSWLEAYATEASHFPAAAADGEECQCAAVVLNSDTGGIAAILGGREHTAQLSLNRAISMRRQPGSAIKPVMVYAPAIEYKGYTTVSMLLDQPEDFSGYTPRNSGSNYRGWVTLRDAVAYSINLPAVKLLRDVGVETAKAYASSVGVVFTDQDDSLTLALGGFSKGVTPLELAASYMPFASGGYYDAPEAIYKIIDKDGNIVYQHEDDKKSVLSAETAYIMNSLLHSTVEYGTAKSLNDIAVNVCAKTGTSTYDDAVNNKDAWIVSYNPQYTVCCWMGFDNTDDAHSLPQGVTGGTYPAEMVGALFSHIYEGEESPEFTAPSDIVEIAVDQEVLENRLEAQPVSGEDKALLECFRASAIPTSLRPLATDIFVDDSGAYPVIHFTGYSGYTYVLERREVGGIGFTLIGRTAGGTAVTDTTAAPETAYVYRLTPEDFSEEKYQAYYLYMPS